MSPPSGGGRKEKEGREWEGGWIIAEHGGTAPYRI